MAGKKIKTPDEFTKGFPTSSEMKKTILPDPKIPDKMKPYITWADPDPFVQLNRKTKKHIGVANPYVLAPIKLGEVIDWKTLDSATVQNTLMRAFDVRVFADIFNPKKSILYSQKELTALLSTQKIPDPGKTAQTGAGAPAPTGKVAKTYDPISPSINYPPPGWEGVPLTTPLQFQKSPAGATSSIVNDSVQGACKNCYFIAALYSKVWCNYPKFPPTPPTPTSIPPAPPCPDGFNVVFYTEAGGSVTKCATLRFPVDDNKQPVFAQLTTKWELYSAVYEKAYALFTGLKTPSGLPKATTRDPEIIEFPPGSPLLSLFHITKTKWDFTNANGINQPSAFLTKNFPQFGFASSLPALNVNLMDSNGTSRKTKYPTVAWTYATRPTCSDLFFKDSSGHSINPYGNDLIVPSHSYSILGTVNLPDGNKINQDYIVLRNPWGANWVDPSGSIGPYLATGTYSPPPAVPELKIDLGKRTDGIFGLRRDVFDCLFEAFGWVQFR